MVNFFLIYLFKICFAESTYSLESYQYIQQSQVAQSDINFNNQVLKQAYLDLHLDLRAEYKWQNDSQLFVLRPRFEAYQTEAQFGHTENIKVNQSKLDLTDAFFKLDWSSQITSTIGLQVYQWGPGEFLNVSNSMYHFNSQQRSVLFKEKGQVLFRLNYLLNAEESLIFLVKPLPNNEVAWIAEDQFGPQALIKYEKNWSGTANQIGFVFGNSEKKSIYLGQYFNFNYLDVWSFYADVKQTNKKLNYQPVQLGLQNNLATADQKTDWNTLALLGVRFEGDYDVRIEFIHNQAGFDRDEYNLVQASASQFLNPNYFQNINRYKSIGLELLTKNYIYFSYRITEPYGILNSNLYLRSLNAITVTSSQTQIEFDRSATDNLGFFTGLSFSDGNLNSEFRLIQDWSFFAGLKFNL